MSAARGQHRGLAWSLALAALAWLCVDGWLIPPDFGHLDIYYFKDSGINLAEGLGLTTRFSYGNASFDYRDYSQYPPLYPLLFGLYVKVFGVSAVSNQLHNSLIAVLLALVGCWALCPLVGTAGSSRRRPFAEFGLGFVLILVGLDDLSYDRPDGLGTMFGLAAVVLALRGRSLRSGVGAGGLAALALFTSPFCGLFTAAVALAGMLAVGYRERSSPLRRMAVVGFSGMAAVLLMLGALRIGLPGWFDGFFGVASGANTQNETGGGYFLALLHGDVATWLGGFAYSSSVPLALLLKLCAVTAALAASLLAAVRGGTPVRRAAGSLLPMIVLAPMCLIVAPYQSNYAVISAALLLGAWAALETRCPSGGGGAAGLILAAVAANVALSLPSDFRERIVRVAAANSLPRCLQYLHAHREMLELPGRFTAVSPTNYIMWRQAGLHPLITVYSGFRLPANRARVEILALSYPGSGNPLSPQLPEFFPLSEYERISAPVLPQEAHFLGRVISNSSQTWESAVYGRSPGR